MADDRPTLLTTYPIEFLGLRIAGSTWAKVRDALAGTLAGLATGTRSNALWGDSYAFPDPAAAVQGWTAALDRAKGAVRWKSGDGPLPVQFLLHDPDPQAPPLGLTPRAWSLMAPEALYATKRAWDLWKGRGRTASLPPHQTRDELPAAVRVSLEGRPEPDAVQLFPARTAPLAGSAGECFYCGLRDHHPARCPSRNLRPDVSGLTALGQLPLAQADRLYRTAFPARGKPRAEFPGETGPGDLRRHPEWQALAAFYDLKRVFQPRFLVTLYLSASDHWPARTVARGGCGTSDSPICRGTRALVAGNYTDAEALFTNATGTGPDTRFFAEVGLALIAVEQGRPKRVRHHLERSSKAAVSEAERMYAQLLLSRWQEVSGDLPGALRIMDAALEQRRPCDEARYRRDQLAVLAGRADGCAQRLQLVASRHPEAAVALLLDPWLEPVRPDLDRKLLTLFLAAQQGGKGKLAAALDQSAALAAWLGEQDPDVEPVIAGLQRLGSRAARAGYCDLLELERDADRLAASCDRTRRARGNALRKQLDAMEQGWEPLERFWRGFGPKRMYRKLDERFTQVRGDLARARQLIEGQDVAAYGEASALLLKVAAAISELSGEIRAIGAVPLIGGFLRRLLGYLVLMESVALTVGLAVLPLFRTILGPGRGSAVAAGGDRGVLYALSFAVAPVLALVAAVLKQGKAAPAPPAAGGSGG